MKTLGTLEGTGRLHVDGKDVGPVDYTIHVRQAEIRTGRGKETIPGLKDGHGSIRGSDPILSAAMRAEKPTTIVLSDGGVVEVIINQMVAGSGQASIATSGPVPGY